MGRALARLSAGRLCLLSYTDPADGVPRRALVAVAAVDPGTGALHLVCASGPGTPWYRAVRRDPRVAVDYAGRRVGGRGRAMTPEESAACLAAYAHRRPRTVRRLLARRGNAGDYRPVDVRGAGRDRIPFVELAPGPRSDW